MKIAPTELFRVPDYGNLLHKVAIHGKNDARLKDSSESSNTVYMK